MSTRYTTYGPVRGMGPIRDEEIEAQADLMEDRDGCASQGGYSDRMVYEIDKDGYLMDDDGNPVWPPHGRSTGAVRVPDEKVQS